MFKNHILKTLLLFMLFKKKKGKTYSEISSSFLLPFILSYTVILPFFHFSSFHTRDLNSIILSTCSQKLSLEALHQNYYSVKVPVEEDLCLWSIHHWQVGLSHEFNIKLHSKESMPLFTNNQIFSSSRSFFSLFLLSF